MKRANSLLLVNTLGLILVSASSLYVEKSPARVLISEDRSVEDGYMVRIETSGKTRELRLTPLKSIWSDDALSLSISRNDGGEKVFEYKKIPSVKVYHNDETGSVLSLTDGKLSGVLDSDYMIKYENGQHYVMKSTEKKFDHIDFREIPNDVRKMIDNSIFKEERQDTTKKPIPVMIKDYFRQTTTYNIEITIIVDSTLANLIGIDANIYEYLTIFWNGVNKRYQTISSPTINIKLVGSFIIRNSADEPFITNNLNGTKAYGDKVLDAATYWVFSHSSTLPARDLVYVQTGRDLLMEDGDTGLLGIAYVGTTCINDAGDRSIDVGLGEDLGTFYDGVLTAAHEVAHLLGAPHDGDANDGTEACPWNDGYIMSYEAGSYNGLYFSSCSISTMFNYLGSTTAACVRSDLIQTTPPGVYTSTSLPGNKITMIEQCKRLTGSNQAQVFTSVPQNTHCYNLHCTYPDGDSRRIKETRQPACEGAACPTSGKCHNGACV